MAPLAQIGAVVLIYVLDHPGVDSSIKMEHASSYFESQISPTPGLWKVLK